MDDILAKKNRHLFLEEKDNTHNSFIRNINYAVENIDTIKTFNDNVNSGTMQHLLETYLEQVGTEGNAWVLKLTELGESILATTSGFNYAAVLTVTQDIEAGATITLPEAMKYRVGTHMLLVSWNGTVCYNDEQYEEVGAFNEKSTVIKIKQNIKTGDKLEFRTVALADTASVHLALGDAITTYAFPVNSSNTERTLIERFSDVINIKDYGAKGDGITDDSVAVQAAIDNGGTIYFPKGVYCISKEISVTKAGTRLVGDGMGGGYRADGKTPYTFHTDVTTLLFVENTQANRSRVRTRYLARPTSASPNDPPMSVCINVQAEHVHIQDLAVKLDITLPAGYLANPASYIGNVTEGANYGVDLDVGIFVGTRCHFIMRDCMVLGYFRKAGIWVDSTQSANLPRFADAEGNTYSDSNVSNGADGFELYNVLVYGGFWALRMQGPMPVNPDTIYAWSPDSIYPSTYYDSVSGQTVEDQRGLFGMSDVLLSGSSLYGCCHHTDVVWTAFDDSDSATAFTSTLKYGGSMCVSGMASNPHKRIQGHRYIATRFTSGGPYGIYLGLTNRDLFLGCMEDREPMYSSEGALLSADASTMFGLMVPTKNATRIKFIASAISIISSIIDSTFTNSDRVLCLGNESQSWVVDHLYRNVSIGSEDPEEYNDSQQSQITLYANDDKNSSIQFAARTQSAETTGKIKNILRAYNSKSGSSFVRIFTTPGGASESVDTVTFQGASSIDNVSHSGSKDVHYNIPDKHNWMVYDTSKNLPIIRALYDSSSTSYKVTTSGDVRPYTHAVDSLGISAFRYTTVWLSSGAINDSDERIKQQIQVIPDAVLDAWGDVNWQQYKFNTSVEEKGEAARLHTGLIAQRIDEAFRARGLDASKYGLFCHDEWPDQFEDVSVVDVPASVDENGDLIPAETHIERRLVKKAGDQYSLRYEECLCMEAAYQRWLGEKRDAKIEALMQRISVLENNQ